VIVQTPVLDGQLACAGVKTALSTPDWVVSFQRKIWYPVAPATGVKVYIGVVLTFPVGLIWVGAIGATLIVTVTVPGSETAPKLLATV
jgi:hypothetical protein